MGGSSTKQTTSTQYPEWYTDMVRGQVQKAEDISKLGYTPYMGPETAAFAPQQVDAMQQAANWSAAFGGPGAQAVDVAGSLPQPTDYGNNMRGYSSFPGYLEQLDTLKQMYPGQHAYINSFVINPYDAPPGYEGYYPGSGQAGGATGDQQASTDPISKKSWKKLGSSERSNYFSYGGKYYPKDPYSDWYAMYGPGGSGGEA